MEKVTTNECFVLTQAERARYDANFKAFLVNKNVLAPIIKSNCEEYAELSNEEIISLIEGEPTVGLAPLDPGLSNFVYPKGTIAGINTESVMLEEGTVRFDILTYILSPERTKRNAIILNIEAQNAGLGKRYPYGERAIYYWARLISSQKNRETVGFMGTEYENLHKVYSIWIVAEGIPRRKTSVSGLVIAPKKDESFLKTFHVNYDFMEILFLYIGDDWKEWYNQNRSISLLGLYLDPGKEFQEKCREMEEDYRIPMSVEIEENIKTQTSISYAMERKLNWKYQEKFEEEIRRRDGVIAKKEDEIAKKDDEIAKKEDEIAKKDDEIAKRDDEIAKKEDEIAKKEDEIAKKEDEIAKKEDEIAKRDDEIAKRDDEIARLRRMLSEVGRNAVVERSETKGRS